MLSGQSRTLVFECPTWNLNIEKTLIRTPYVSTYSSIESASFFSFFRPFFAKGHNRGHFQLVKNPYLTVYLYQNSKLVSSSRFLLVLKLSKKTFIIREGSSLLHFVIASSPLRPLLPASDNKFNSTSWHSLPKVQTYCAPQVPITFQKTFLSVSKLSKKPFDDTGGVFTTPPCDSSSRAATAVASGVR